MNKNFVNRQVFALLLILAGCTAGNGFADRATAEMTKGQAIARVRSILKNSTSGCRINKVTSVSAVRVSAGWRVTAHIVMSSSGRRVSERAVWIVSQSKGAAAQDQLTAEIANRCNN